jgi:Tol biopolymer transport system component
MKFKLCIFMAFLIILIGCLPNPAEIQPSPTAVTKQVSLTPTNKLQLTYIQNNDNFGELYVSDINCMTRDEVCFGEPKLLFGTLTMPNSEQNKPKGLLTDYSWSPDGNRIALVSTGDILIGDMNMQSWKNITNSSDADEYQPKWSSDGNSVYYRACPRTIEGNYGGHSTCRLYRSDLTGKVEFNLLSSKGDYYNSHDVSSDGQKVVFTLTDNQGYDQIYLANLDGSDSRQITEGQINNSAPSFSPDGKKIIFVRFNKSGGANSLLQADIFLKYLETGEEKSLTEEFDGDVFAPVYSPDGKWAAFSSFDTELNANIFIVSLEQESIIQVTQGNEETRPAWRWFSGQ